MASPLPPEDRDPYAYESYALDLDEDFPPAPDEPLDDTGEWENPTTPPTDPQ